MKSLTFAKTATVAAIALVFAGCSSTTRMTHTEKDTAVGAGTALSRIVQMVQNAQASKAPARFTLRSACCYV